MNSVFDEYTLGLLLNAMSYLFFFLLLLKNICYWNFITNLYVQAYILFYVCVFFLCKRTSHLWIDHDEIGNYTSTFCFHCFPSSFRCCCCCLVISQLAVRTLCVYWYHPFQLIRGMSKTKLFPKHVWSASDCVSESSKLAN